VPRSKSLPARRETLSGSRRIRTDAKTIIELPGMAAWPDSFIYDQGNLGSAISNAIAFVVKYFSVRQFGLNGHLDPSRLYLYWNARHFEQTVMPESGINTNIDSGTSVFGALLSLKETGCAPESVNWNIGTVRNSELVGTYVYKGWAYSDNTTQFKIKPDPMSYTIALTEDISFDSVGKGQLSLGAQSDLWDESLPKVNPFPSLCKNITSYDIASPYRKTNPAILNTVAEKAEVRTKIVNALAKGHPVLIGLYLDNSFYNASTRGLVPLPNLATFQPIGGHTVVIIGYGPYISSNPQTMYFKAINSWGSKWGDKGYLYFPDEYITNVNRFQAEIFDMWHPSNPRN
jgi:C1A family cysteine protease